MKTGIPLWSAVWLGGLLAGASCGPARTADPVFTPREDGLEIAWNGPPGARFLLFSGAADGPHYPRNDGRTWTTVAADPYGTRIKPSAEGVFDAKGALRLRVAWSELPSDPQTVLQGLAFDDARTSGKACVTPAIVVRGRHAGAVVLPHVTALMLGPRAPAYAAAFLALIGTALLRRRLRPIFDGGFSRTRVVLIFAAVIGTAWLLSFRDPSSEATHARRLLLDLMARPSAETARERAVGPEITALLDAVRTMTPPGADLDVVAPFQDRMPPVLFRYAEASFPGRRVRAFDAATSRPTLRAPFAVQSGVDDGAADVLFRNAAGALLRVGPTIDREPVDSRPR